jgi:hypothetical protein
VGKTVPVTVGVPFGTVACDIFGPLRETSNGNTHILVVTDLFTNMMVLRPLRNLDATQVAQKLLDGVITRFGLFKRIIFDSGPQFNGRVINRLCARLGATKTMGIKLYHNSNSAVDLVSGGIEGVASSMGCYAQFGCVRLKYV